ncbi:conserved hypothetical protein [Acinetobacter proteolyticus]|uniref:Single-stranded DNA-binding protein n=1 Tax=Acinetobacter proteolyticus TaxID=1776741 RepID=A0A653KDC9_9GAMM|nr:hypothetical protein [Acinetobacter proteolyticus]VXA58398.1 conserved hypothetical protein [Acinetobacter proteolyticus]
MQFKTQLVVLGAKSSKGEFNGRPFDSTTVFYQAELQEGENFAGQVGADFKWGTSANFEKIKNHKFPFMADCVLEQVSNGKTTVTILKELTPVAQPAK